MISKEGNTAHSNHKIGNPLSRIVDFWCRCSVAVPGVRLAHGGAALHTDRCHSLESIGTPTAKKRDTIWGISLFLVPVTGLEPVRYR